MIGDHELAPPANEPYPDCPKCGGHMERGYGLAGGGCGFYAFCFACDYSEAHPDFEGYSEEAYRAERLRADTRNATVDRGCDQKRGLVLTDRVYEKRHRLPAGALGSDHEETSCAH